MPGMCTSNPTPARGQGMPGMCTANPAPARGQGMPSANALDSAIYIYIYIYISEVIKITP